MLRARSLKLRSVPSLRLKLAPWGWGLMLRARSLKLRSVPSLRLKLAPWGWGVDAPSPQPSSCAPCRRSA